MSYGCENSDLVDGIVDLSWGEVNEFDFFEGVDSLVDDSFDFVDA